MAAGIYQILNTVNGKRYIGSAVNVKRRWVDHRKHLRKGVHHSRYLQRAWNSGCDEHKFLFELLITCAPSMLLHYEQQLISQLRPEYNMTAVAGSRLGVKASAETRAKLSAAHKGRILPPERIAAMVGRKQSPVTIAKRSASMVGHPVSDATKLKIGAANKGAVRTPEQVEAMRLRSTGVTQTSESNAKRSATMKRRFANVHE